MRHQGDTGQLQDHDKPPANRLWGLQPGAESASAQALCRGLAEADSLDPTPGRSGSLTLLGFSQEPTRSNRYSLMCSSPEVDGSLDGLGELQP